MVKGEGGEYVKKCCEEGEELYVVVGVWLDFKCNVC